MHAEAIRLVGGATERTLTGYGVEIADPCGVTLIRHVSAAEAVVHNETTQILEAEI